MKNTLNELKFCLDLWKSQGHCTFGGKTHCENCAAPYLLYKMLTDQIIHQDKRLKLNEWLEKLENLPQIDQ